MQQYSPALFALIIFCFLLPFFELSFSGQKVASMNGVQLLSFWWGYSESQEIKAELGHPENSGTPND